MRIHTAIPLQLTERGVTLIEAVLAALLLAVSAIVIALIFPKSNQAVANTKMHMQGNMLANTLLQTLADQSCATATVTDPTQVHDPNFSLPPINCDCSQEPYINLPQDPTTPTKLLEGTTYTQRECINWEQATAGGGGVTSTCTQPPAQSACLKNIRTNVSWVIGATAKSVDSTTMLYSN